jgi:phosphoglucomutase
MRGSFTESHVLAITQAICDFRRCVHETDGPLYMGKDTRGLSGPAQRTALEVLAANDIETVIQQDNGVTPAPVISHAILAYNRDRKKRLADGILITPSHNLPDDGGIRYAPPTGGPATAYVTDWLESRANELLKSGNAGVRRLPILAALLAPTTHQEDFVMPYVRDLRNVVDMSSIKAAGLKLAVDPMGGAGAGYWEPINSVYGLEIQVVNPAVDPSYSFMPADHDGRIRMDCSSPYAMARLLNLKNRYRLSFANNPAADRHGIVTPAAGLINSNHYLAVAIQYLLTHRPKWSRNAVVGKSLVSSTMIDRAVRKLDRHLCELPMGFAWFSPGLLDGSFCFGGEENSAASFLRQDGTTWTTDKDGLVMNLLAAEITARTGGDLDEHYRRLTAEFGDPCFTRVELPATSEQKLRLEQIAPAAVRESHLAGQPILAKLTRAPGNLAPIRGVKIVSASGWFSAHPSATSNIYRIYAESFQNPAHLDRILREAQVIIEDALHFTDEQ